MLRGPRYRRLFVGVHADVTLPLDLAVWLQAAFLVAPADAMVTSLTGLHLRGIHVGAAWPLRLASSHPHPVRRVGLAVVRVRTHPHGSVRVANVEHCFATGCQVLDLVDAVSAADALVHQGRATMASLTTAAEVYDGRGARLARRAVSYARVGVESLRETLVRLLLVLAGLPEPRCNLDVRAGHILIGRGDLVYEELRLIVEYDGRQHAEDARQWERDIDRLDHFEDATWGHVRITARRLRRPRDVVLRVHAKMVARGYRGPAPVFGPEWVELFETRTAADRARRSARPDSWAVECAPDALVAS